jgi:hypothetical protein
MDAFTFIISLTVAVAGFFLYRDYASFLRGTYAKYGRVVSIHQVFSSYLYQTEAHGNATPYVKNGFYPVIEYSLDQQPVRFTAIDQHASGNFHIGDKVKLRIISTRRQRSRTCKTLIALISMISILALTMIWAALSSSFSISLGQILLSSSVIAASLSVLILYQRDQEQHYTHEFGRTKSGKIQLYIPEPAAFKNWSTALSDPTQRIKIRGSQVCGATCIAAAFIMLSIALQPMLQLLLQI